MYKFRGLTSAILPEYKLWCVSGTYTTSTEYNGRVMGSGILEWCYSEADAQYRKNMMMLDDRFGKLRAHKFIEGI